MVVGQLEADLLVADLAQLGGKQSLLRQRLVPVEYLQLLDEVQVQHFQVPAASDSRGAGPHCSSPPCSGGWRGNVSNLKGLCGKRPMCNSTGSHGHPRPFLESPTSWGLDEAWGVSPLAVNGNQKGNVAKASEVPLPWTCSKSRVRSSLGPRVRGAWSLGPDLSPPPSLSHRLHPETQGSPIHSPG